MDLLAVWIPINSEHSNVAMSKGMQRLILKLSIEEYDWTTPAAWNDPAKGAELAQGQIDRGADVVYQAAGGTGAGVIQAAVDAGKLAIGVDVKSKSFSSRSRY